MGKVQKLVLDAGPLISQTREEILAKGEKLYATPAVIHEIRDENARRRLELLKDHITVQQPTAEAVNRVSEFAKLTGDGLVLSTQDIEVIALAYDLVEDKLCLRSRPKVASADNSNPIVVNNESSALKEKAGPGVDDDGFTIVKSKTPKPRSNKKYSKPKETEQPKEVVPPSIEDLSIEDNDGDWPEDDWISPDNIHDKMVDESTKATAIENDVEVAVASRDYAVQNVTLQMGLSAVNERGLRIKQLKSYMQRCYACFKLVPLGVCGVSNSEGATRQFCPQCGGHTLTRVSTSVDKHGQLHVHLKKKMQWITRGDRYNVPSPQSQRARRQQHDQKVEFYAEDQPEYMKALKKQHIQQRRNERIVNDYIGPSTVDTAMSPFAPSRTAAHKVQIGRGRYANATGKKTDSLNK